MSFNNFSKTIYIVLGWISLLLGVIGAFLPLLPTTPFVILAAYLFSKSSPRLHSWLTSNPYFGDAIIDWERHGVIRPKAKKMATLMIVLVMGSSIVFTNLHIGLKTMLACIAAGVLTFIWSRNSHPLTVKDDSRSESGEIKTNINSSIYPS